MDLKIDVLVILALVLFIPIFVIIKRNKSDRKAMEKQFNAKEIKPEKHDEDHI